MRRDILELQEVIKKLVPLLTAKKMKVTQMGAEAYVMTDPATGQPSVINIPMITEDATPEFLQALQGFIDHEVAHVLFTNFSFTGRSPSFVTDKDGQKAFAQLHNLVEDTMIERQIVTVFPGSKKNITRTAEFFFENVSEKAIKKARDKAGSNPDLKERAENIVGTYLVPPMMRALSGQICAMEYMKDHGYWDHPVVKKMRAAFTPQMLKSLTTCKTTKETFAIAEQVFKALYQAPPEQDSSGGKSDKKQSPGSSSSSGKSGKSGKPSKNGDGKSGGKPKKSEKSEDEAADPSSDDEDEDKNEGEGEENADEGGNESGDAGGNDADGESDSSDGDGDDGEDDDGEGSSKGDGEDEEDEENEDDVIEVDDFDQESGGDATEGLSHSSGGGIGTHAAEKSILDTADAGILEEVDLSKSVQVMITDEAVKNLKDTDEFKSFTNEFDKIEPIRVNQSQMERSWVPDMHDTVANMIGPMQKGLERALADKNFVIHTPGHKKGKLHAPDFHKLMRNDSRVFKQKQESTALNTAVMLLVDNSGSMSGAKMRTAMLAAYGLATTLERVKVPCEMIGFTTGNYFPDHAQRAMTRDSSKGVHYDRYVELVMPIYKTFSERVDSTVKERIAFAMNTQRGLAGNIDSESLKVAAERIALRPEKRKVIIVLSDGAPAGGGKDAGQLKRRVADLNKSGIDCIGIGIKSGEVKHYYDRHVILQNIEDLPGEVMATLRRILAK